MDGKLKVWWSKRQELLCINDHFFLFSYLITAAFDGIVVVHYIDNLVYLFLWDMIVSDKSIYSLRVHVDGCDYFSISEEF